MGGLKQAWLRALLATAALAAVWAGGSDITASAQAPGPAGLSAASDIDPGSITVRARRPADLDQLAAYALAEGYGVRGRIEELSALQLVLPHGVTVERAITAFTGRPGVLYAEPVYEVRKADLPADPLFGRQSSYLRAVQAPQAWDIETGKSDVVVAVVDTGIDLNHPDLQGRIWQNLFEIPNNSVDEDGNGCIDDVNGCAFVTNPSPGCSGAVNGFVRDDIGHGTFVSGIIAANGNNGQGMVGVARGVTVLSVKVLDCQGRGESVALAQGILYAAKRGAAVINISLGGTNDSVIVREAVRAAHDQNGALIVAASGNSGQEGVSYPARYPGVLAVGAASIANPDKRAKFSSTGPQVSVVAVGENIVGTVPQSSCGGGFLPCVGGPYATGSGTSFAAPQVSGLVALILSRSRGLKPDAIIATIEEAATAVPAGDRPNWAGAGRINMAESLRPAYQLGAPGLTRN